MLKLVACAVRRAVSNNVKLARSLGWNNAVTDVLQLI